MAYAFDASVAGTGSNSYATLTQANDYLTGRLRVTDWTGATTQQQQLALTHATMQINGLRFIDEDRRPVYRQRLKFPRWRDPVDASGAYEILREIREATAIQALALLNTNAAESEARARLQSEGVKAFKLGDLSESYSDASARSGLASSITPEAFELVSHLLDTTSDLYRSA